MAGMISAAPSEEELAGSGLGTARDPDGTGRK
jgi:hypothetical protein